MTPEQLAQAVKDRLAQCDQIHIGTLADDIGAPVQDVAAIVRQLPEWHMGEVTGTITRAKPTHGRLEVEGHPV